MEAFIGQLMVGQLEGPQPRSDVTYRTFNSDLMATTFTHTT